MNKILKLFKSWTINTSILLASLGVAQANIGMLELKPRHQGIALIIIGVVMALLRAKTTTSLKDR